MISLPARKEAAQDLVDAMVWYNRKSQGLGFELLQEVKENVATIQRYPAGFREVVKTIRQCALKRFPYVLLYYAKESDVLIVGVFHTSRNPEEKLN